MAPETAATHAYLNEWRNTELPGALSHKEAMALLLHTSANDR